MNDVWNFAIYDAFGKLVAEYGQAEEGVGGVSYIQQDWQGSVRTVSNSNGHVVSRTDHQAFGEAIGMGVGLRSTAQGYWGTVATRQGYGLTEADEATGLDHTWFRKNEGFAGRWTSPDPYKGSMDLGDPQSVNRYSYVVNQPTNFVDPSGLAWQCNDRFEVAYTSVCIGNNCESSIDWDNSGWVTTCSWVNDGPGPVITTGGGGGGGGGIGSEPQVIPANHVEDRRKEKFDNCVRDKMKGMTKKLNALMNDNMNIWALGTALGGLAGPVGGLAGSAMALQSWRREFNKFREEEYDPARTNARADCLNQVYGSRNERYA